MQLVECLCLMQDRRRNHEHCKNTSHVDSELHIEKVTCVAPSVYEIKAHQKYGEKQLSFQVKAACYYESSV